MKGNWDIHLLLEREIISTLDTHFARLMGELSSNPSPELILGAALVSSSTREGNVCLDLPNLELRHTERSGEGFALPGLAAWEAKLRESDVVGYPGEYKPLILDHRGRLYLYRYWDYQAKLANFVRSQVREADGSLDRTLLKEELSRLFPDRSQEDLDWQKVAAFTALSRGFSVISGGPGTGKTTTVAKILALLLKSRGPEKLRIGLVSPTGKGASRLEGAIRKVKESLDCEDRIRDAIPEEASTIHRLLGTIGGSPYFRHHEDNKLPLDALIVDEASMVDLALMSKLVQALPLESRVILLGDKDQLASVEAGAVLGDICDAGQSLPFSKSFSHGLQRLLGCKIEPEEVNGDAPSMRDCIVFLTKSYRFKADSGIAAVSHAVNDGDGERALSIIENEGHEDIEWKDFRHLHDWGRVLKEMVIQGFGAFLKAADPFDAFARLDDFRILCGLREGPYGVEAVNSMVERMLREEHLIKVDGQWYPGRPVLITRNDYNLRLFNGDMGIALPDPGAGDELRVFFQDSEGRLRKFHPLRLPEHEAMYAVTVHKSQGSEFDEILFLLPDRDSPVLTRELIYTAITRARERVQIWGNADVFRDAVARRTVRTSGLRDALLSAFL
jgi:exodeoxyribonuclease V alpha subunit